MCILLMDAKNAIKMETILITTRTARTEPNADANTGNSARMMLMRLPVIATTMSWNDTNGHRLQSANHDTILKGP